MDQRWHILKGKVDPVILKAVSDLQFTNMTPVQVRTENQWNINSGTCVFVCLTRHCADWNRGVCSLKYLLLGGGRGDINVFHDNELF